MDIFLVGGALRDFLLHRPVSDQDWVVVGAVPQQMVDLGFLPVGKDFPVFLHPQTRQEYALARTERKTNLGYKGFAVYAHPDVTLEQDLERRDLTINAMALAQSHLPLDFKNFHSIQSFIVDPFNGQHDLQNKVLRHVGPAFVEDPVRILRLARFAARYDDFTVATETMNLMQEMVQLGEVNALVAERVWQELAKGLTESKPSKMMQVLHDCGALKILIPQWDGLWQNQQQLALALAIIDQAALPYQHPNNGLIKNELSVHFCCFSLVLLLNDWKMATSKATIEPTNNEQANQIKNIANTLKVPVDCKDLAIITAREFNSLLAVNFLNTNELLDLLERLDAFRKPQRFLNILTSVDVLFKQLFAFNYSASFDWGLNTLKQAFQICTEVDTLKVAEQAMASGLTGSQIGLEIKKVRQKSLFSKLI
jgi:tRNA nucleotidyltransferase (CCA-adding enzyme)